VTKQKNYYQVALLGRSNDHDESGDDVVSRDGDAEQEHGVEEASQVVDRVLKIPRRRLINVRILICHSRHSYRVCHGFRLMMRDHYI